MCSLPILVVAIDGLASVTPRGDVVDGTGVWGIGCKKQDLTPVLHNAPMRRFYEKLESLPNAEQLLKNGITFEQLDAQALAVSDNDAAQRLNTARATLFETIFNRSKSAA